ncbi:hypothetical protein PIB30_049270 [Stylosanthes scabra]|uniref:Uncharacterized protein n=1 Tax=Stylosanthes scabra TaxID=79078 RepID=A0ABU6XFN1_9FABA|nr:hypothetical protein [Stylosanthes scabra]
MPEILSEFRSYTGKSAGSQVIQRETGSRLGLVIGNHVWATLRRGPSVACFLACLALFELGQLE